MENDDLKAFKIGDKQRRTIRSTALKDENAAEAQLTVGFKNIENLLDQESPMGVGTRLVAILDSIDAYLAQAKNPKDRSAAQKARATLERTIDLLDYLFKVKAALSGPNYAAALNTATPNRATAAKEAEVASLVPLTHTDVVLFLEAGYLYMELNKPRDAEDVFLGVAALLPHSDVPQMALGNLQFSQGHFAKAYKSHKKALELKPHSAAAHAACAEALLFLHRDKEALEHIEQALRLDPTGPTHQFAAALREAHAMGIFSNT